MSTPEFSTRKKTSFSRKERLHLSILFSIRMPNIDLFRLTHSHSVHKSVLSNFLHASFQDIHTIISYLFLNKDTTILPKQKLSRLKNVNEFQFWKHPWLKSNSVPLSIQLNRLSPSISSLSLDERLIDVPNPPSTDNARCQLTAVTVMWPLHKMITGNKCAGWRVVG